MIQRILPTILLAAVGPLMLAACSSPGGQWSTESSPLAVPRGQVQANAEPRDMQRAPPVPRPRPHDSHLSDLRGADPQETVEKTTLPPPKLVGLSADQTEELLGQPAERVEQPPGKVWTYRTGGCVLVVHLFPDMEKGGFYALDYTSEGDGNGREACLTRAAEARRHLGGERAALPGGL